MSHDFSERFVVKAATDPVVLRVSLPAPMLSELLAAEVDALWEEALRQRAGTLFEGRLFTLKTVTAGEWHGALVPYRRFIAQRARPWLFEDLPIRPVAITGALICRDGVIAARRSDVVEMDRGLWELAPSGGIDGAAAVDDRIDPREQVLHELEEELGLTGHDLVAPLRVFALVHDRETHVADIGYVLRTALPFADIRRRFEDLGRREHRAIAIVAGPQEADGLPASDLAPVSRLLLSRLAAEGDVIARRFGAEPERSRGAIAVPDLIASREQVERASF